MEFLVHMNNNIPPEMDSAIHDELYRKQNARAVELTELGYIKRLWRVPARRENWGLWEAKDATDTHAALISLPLWRYQDITVIALAQNGNDPAMDDTTRREIKEAYPLGG